MLQNYFKIAFRSITKHKFFSAIKIISLAIGLSASFVIGLMVYYDLSFDTFHPDKERIYRITTEFTSPEGSSYNPGVSYPLGTTLKEKVPGLQTIAPILTAYPLHVRNVNSDQLYKRPEFVVYTDAEYFTLFQYDWIAGSKKGLLQNPNELILTENRAKHYFPDMSFDQIVGSTLVYNDTIPVKVTGIVANFNKPTDLVFEEFISLKTADQADLTNAVTDADWGSTTSASQLFVKIAPQTIQSDIQKELDRITKEYNDEGDVARGRIRNFYMQPLKDLHFDQNYYTFDFNDEYQASKSTLISLGSIALFLLLLGCINFINLNTAQATQRAKEIGIRKTLGSSKRQLVIQFLGETFLLTLAAAVLSIFFSYWLLDFFSDFTPNGLNFELFGNPVILLSIFTLLFIVTLLSGFYPALVLSHFKPVSILKNQVLGKGDNASLRKYLTVFQFCIAQIFVIATFLVSKQINYLMTKDMGFKTEAIASVRTPWHKPDFDKRKLLAQRIEALPMVKGISLSGNPPASNSTSTTGTTFLDGEKEIYTQLQVLNGDTNYLDLYDIQLLAGRDRLNDTIREYVINDTYRKLLGFQSPQEAIGRFLGRSDAQFPIVGVVEDFNQRSLKTGIEPMAIIGDWNRHRWSGFNTVHFAFQTGDTQSWPEAIAQIESVYEDIYPEAEFQLTFMDDIIQKFYVQEKKTATLLQWAMWLSIAISCLGLFGLVVYTTERRTKEIGIRKVLGASLVQLNLLLCKEFLMLIGIAFLIAAPIAWYGLNNWLQDFAFKTELSWWVFAVSGTTMFLLALLIISVRTITKANANPVKSLRTE